MEYNKERSLSIQNNDDTFSTRTESVMISDNMKPSLKSSKKSYRLSALHGVSQDSSNSKKVTNPFKFSDDIDIFALRDDERKARLEEKVRQRNLKVYEKTYGIELKSRRNQIALLNDPDDLSECSKKDGRLILREDPDYAISTIKDRPIEKETLTEYITKKREMFKIQYALGVKREEMRKLNEISTSEGKKLEMAEQFLVEDREMFEVFLKENDKNSANAIKIAENAGKERMQKVVESKALTAQLLQIKSEINKYGEQLKEYKLYKSFLDKLIPDNVQNERKAASEARREAKRKLKKEDEENQAKLSKENSDIKSQGSRKKSVVKKQIELPITRRDSSGEPEFHLDDYSSDDSDEELYFNDPQELLNMFMELEESNLSLIQTCQETEETLEELKEVEAAIKTKMKMDTDILKQQIDTLDQGIALQQQKLDDIEIKKQLFAHNDVTAENQDARLDIIHSKVEGVYRNCVSDLEAKMSTLDMLTCIENELDNLFEQIDRQPPDKVEIAQKAKEKERRLQIREEKKEQQRLHQEENKQKALERARAVPKKQTGRRIITRSEPPYLKKEDANLNEQKNKEEEEYNYFFT